MAWRDEPVRELRAVMAAAIITEYFGWVAVILGWNRETKINKQLLLRLPCYNSRTNLVDREPSLVLVLQHWKGCWHQWRLHFKEKNM